MKVILSDYIDPKIQLIQQGKRDQVNIDKLNEFASYVSEDVADYVSAVTDTE